MSATQTTDRNRYGVQEMSGLVNPGQYHESVDHAQTMTLAQVAQAGGRITRLRLLTERVPGMGRVADVSYVHATLPDGTVVPVTGLWFSLTPLYKVKGELIAWASKQGVYAKSLGLLDEGNWSVVYG